MNQNVARVERQNPTSTKASILSHSVQEDDERHEINQRSSLEHVEEESGQVSKSPGRLNKDGSAYNIAANDIAAIPYKQNGSPKRSPKKIPSLDVDKLRESNNPSESSRNLGQVYKELRNSAELRVSQARQSQTLKSQKSKASIRSSQQQQNNAPINNKSKLSNTQRSRASLASKKNTGGRDSQQRNTQSMLPALGRQ